MKKMSNTTRKSKINKELASIRQYQSAIPLTEIFDACKKWFAVPVDEDDQPWSGFLCGEKGQANIKLLGLKATLIIGWYKMPSGNYEHNAYVV